MIEHPFLSSAWRRLAQALLTAVGLLLVVGLLSTTGTPCTPPACVSQNPTTVATWLQAALRLDFGRTTDNQAVTVAIAAAAPATALLLALAIPIGLLLGWGGGLLLALGVAKQDIATGWFGRALRLLGRSLALVADSAQSVPTFWLGGVLVAAFSIGTGWLPPGGIAGNTIAAFGTDAYVETLRSQPATVLGDLFSHALLPALTLALAGIATDLRLFSAVIPPALRAPHVQVARAAGLPRRRLAWRALRPAVPALIGGSAAAAPMLASALVLVEYLFGWPGLGLLAYHAARAGDSATLGALLLLFGLIVIAIGLAADLLATWADPRPRMQAT